MNQEERTDLKGPVTGPRKMTPEEAEIWHDLVWAVQDPEVTSKYPDESVAVHRRQILAHFGFEHMGRKRLWGLLGLSESAQGQQ